MSTLSRRVAGAQRSGQARLMSPEEAADRIALRALVEEYAWMADTLDYQRYAALFVTDATLYAVHGPAMLVVLMSSNPNERW